MATPIYPRNKNALRPIGCSGQAIPCGCRRSPVCLPEPKGGDAALPFVLRTQPLGEMGYILVKVFQRTLLVMATGNAPDSIKRLDISLGLPRSPTAHLTHHHGKRVMWTSLRFRLASFFVGLLLCGSAVIAQEAVHPGHHPAGNHGDAHDMGAHEFAKDELSEYRQESYVGWMIRNMA